MSVAKACLTLDDAAGSQLMQTPLPPEKVSPKLLFCKWDNLQAQPYIGDLDVPKATSDFELKSNVYIFL